MDSRVDMINSFTGTVMSVPVELVEGYLAAGHRLATPAQPEELPAAEGGRKAKRRG